MAEEKPKLPNTISDAKWRGLMDRQAKAKTRGMFDAAEVEQRDQSIEQAKKRKWS